MVYLRKGAGSGVSSKSTHHSYSGYFIFCWFICQNISAGILSASVIFALLFMVSIFFTWALAREFDPRHDYAAIIAAVAVFFLYLLYSDLPDILMILWLILGLRYVNQTNGMQTSVVDSVTLFVFTLLLMYVNASIVGFLVWLFSGEVFVLSGKEGYI